MAGRRFHLAFLGAVVSGLLAGYAGGQPPGPPEHRPPSDRPGMPDQRRPFFPKLGPEGDEMRERAMRELQKLSPEKRAELWRAVLAVLNLPPEKRQMVLGFEEERRKRAQEEMTRAIEENGLSLDEGKKQAFFRRYFEERRAIEERLRKESDERRRQLVREMRDKLKAEFTSQPGAPAGVGGAPR